MKIIDPPEKTEVRGRFRFSIKQMSNEDLDPPPFPTCPTFYGEADLTDTMPSVSRLVRTIEPLDESDLEFQEGHQTFSYWFKPGQSETPRYPLIRKQSVYDDTSLQHRFTTNLTIDCEMLFTMRLPYPMLTVQRPTDIVPENEPLIGDTGCDAKVCIKNEIGTGIAINVHKRMLPRSMVESFKKRSNLIYIKDMSIDELMAILRYSYYNVTPSSVSQNIEGIRKKAVESKMLELDAMCLHEMVLDQCYRTLFDVNSLIYYSYPFIIAALPQPLQTFTPSEWISAVRSGIMDDKEIVEAQTKAYFKSLFARNTMPDLKLISTDPVKTHLMNASCELTHQSSVDSAESMPSIDNLNLQEIPAPTDEEPDMDTENVPRLAKDKFYLQQPTTSDFQSEPSDSEIIAKKLHIEPSLVVAEHSFRLPPIKKQLERPRTLSVPPKASTSRADDYMMLISMASEDDLRYRQIPPTKMERLVICSSEDEISDAVSGDQKPIVVGGEPLQDSSSFGSYYLLPSLPSSNEFPQRFTHSSTESEISLPMDKKQEPVEGVVGAPPQESTFGASNYLLPSLTSSDELPPSVGKLLKRFTHSSTDSDFSLPMDKKKQAEPIEAGEVVGAPPQESAFGGSSYMLPSMTSSDELPPSVGPLLKRFTHSSSDSQISLPMDKDQAGHVSGEQKHAEGVVESTDSAMEQPQCVPLVSETDESAMETVQEKKLP